jgi:2-oxoglutarate dehydrogenase E1 component
VLLCSGKIYYDLIQEREKLKRQDAAVIRVEQLYPWPEAAVQASLKRYTGAKEFFWVQDEPMNMGAWSHVCTYWTGPKISYIGRDRAAAPAVGFHHVHDHELEAIVEKSIRF